MRLKSPTTTRVSEDAVDRSGRGTDGEGVGGGGSCTNFGVSDRIGGSPERRGAREGVDQFDSRSDRKEDALPRVDAHELEGQCFQYESLLSKFDDYVANGMGGAYGMGTSRRRAMRLKWGNGMGKGESHPWWPGHIFNEALADPLVRRTKRRVMCWWHSLEIVVMGGFFRMSSSADYCKTFLKAVEEAVDEVGRRCGLRVVCQCRNPYTFRPKGCQDWRIYSADQISNARESFQPEDTLSFVKQLALAPVIVIKNIRWIKNKATAYAYRRAIYEEYDETYAQAFVCRHHAFSCAIESFMAALMGFCLCFVGILLLYVAFPEIVPPLGAFS
ncbi:hypothetical protein AAG906_017081 [Vitis piasezkii]